MGIGVLTLILLIERMTDDKEPSAKGGKGRPASTRQQDNENNEDMKVQKPAEKPRTLTEIDHKQEIQKNEVRFVDNLNSNELLIRSDREPPFTEDELHKFRLQ